MLGVFLQREHPDLKSTKPKPQYCIWMMWENSATFILKSNFCPYHPFQYFTNIEDLPSLKLPILCSLAAIRANTNIIKLWNNGYFNKSHINYVNLNWDTSHLTSLSHAVIGPTGPKTNAKSVNSRMGFIKNHPTRKYSVPPNRKSYRCETVFLKGWLSHGEIKPTYKLPLVFPLYYLNKRKSLYIIS